jgi:hypothetical protein
VCKDVEQHAMIVEEHVKFLKLLELLGQYWEYGNVLVFVEKVCVLFHCWQKFICKIKFFLARESR